MTEQSHLSQDHPIDQSFLLGLLGYNCLQAYLKIEPNIKKKLSRHQLKPVEFTVLSIINANWHINQKRLGFTINVSPPNLATLLDRMEARQLLIRKRNPKDKRSQVLELTEKGRLVYQKAKVLMEKSENAINLTHTEHSQLLLLLQKIFL